MRFFVTCPWGTEVHAAMEIRAAVSPVTVHFGAIVPAATAGPDGTPVDATGVETVLRRFTCDPSVAAVAAPPQASSVMGWGGVPIKGVLQFAIDLASLGDDQTAGLRRLVASVSCLRAVESLCIFIGQADDGIGDAAAAKTFTQRRDVLDATGAAVAAIRAIGVHRNYRLPLSVPTELLKSLRPVGGGETRAGRALIGDYKESPAEETARLDALLEKLAECPSSCPPEQADESVVFRVTATRLDKDVKGVTSEAIANAVGCAIGDEFMASQGWSVSMRFCNTDVAAIHCRETLLLGLRAHQVNAPRGSESIQEQFAWELQRRALGQAIARGEVTLQGARYAIASPCHFKHDFRHGRGNNAMNPALADFLLALAAVSPGDIVLDPMAGSGTIPIECALRCHGTVGIGGDLEPANARVQHGNYERGVVETGCQVYGLPSPFVNGSALLSGGRWNAKRLPLRTAAVDAIVCDLPFGKRCGSAKINERLYPCIMSEFGRVVRPGGRAVLLTVEADLIRRLLTPEGALMMPHARKSLREYGNKAPPWPVRHPHELWEMREEPAIVDMSGLLPAAFVLCRKQAPWAVAAP